MDYLVNPIPCRIKVLVLYGLRFNILNYGFVQFNDYLYLVVENTIKSPGSLSVTKLYFLKT